MAIELKVPTLGESVTEATVSKWFKTAGDPVELDEPIVELGTDKVTVEVNAPVSGALESIAVDEGTDVEVGALLGILVEGKGRAQPLTDKPIPEPASNLPPDQSFVATPPQELTADKKNYLGDKVPKPLFLSPAVRKLVEENGLDPNAILGTGKGGRLTKKDVLLEMESRAEQPSLKSPAELAPESSLRSSLEERRSDPREERVRMTKLRKVIAARLKEAQNTAAMLTTWNEIDLGSVMDLRSFYKEKFEQKHRAKLGFMSFFVRACCIALREWPSINAEVYGDELIYKNYYNIGVAVGTPQGLVVPILKDADQMRFSDIESKIADFGRRARDGKLSMDEMTGGTFTISNGGVFGSLNSMPILNVPQSAILGMHKIQKRPVVVDNEIVIRPMMYLALSYDHRIVDGREAVSFLVRVKECIEDPQRIMLDV